MTTKHTYYTVSVLPEFDPDNYYESYLAAYAVAWDSWAPGQQIAIYKHEITNNVRTSNVALVTLVRNDETEKRLCNY